MTKKFSEDFIQKVMEANDLVQLIGETTPLRPVGHNLMGLCPFPDHREKTPSFSVSPSKQVYHCFGCKKSGNIVTFLKDYHNLSFTEAIEFLARRAHIPIPSQEKSHDDDPMAQQRKVLFAINEFAKNFFHAQLKQHISSVSAFLHQRALTEASIDHFQLGLSLNQRDALVQILKKQKWRLDAAEQLQLIKKKDGEEAYFDFFRHRFMFPIFNHLGQVVGFGGRALEADVQPKYLNSPESPIFSKSQILYGLYQASRHIRAHDQVILVEGYMDVIQLWQAGIPYAVAPMGTALTERQAEMIKRLTSNVIVVFDGDAAGQQAAIRALPILLRANLRPRGIFLPQNLDPDDYLKRYGLENFQSLIRQAPDLLTHIVQLWLQDFRGDPLEKMHWIEKISPLIQEIPDPRLKQIYADELAWKLSVPPHLLLKTKSPPAASEVVRSPSPPTIKPDEPSQMVALSRIPQLDLQFLALVLQFEPCWRKTLEWVELAQYLHSDAREILMRAQKLSRQTGVSFDKLLSLLTTDMSDRHLLFMDQKVYEHLTSDSSDSVVLDYFRDLSKQLQMRYLNHQINEMQKELRQNQDREKLTHLNQLIVLKKKLAQSSEPLITINP